VCRTTDEVKQNLLFATKLYFGKQFENNPKTTVMNKIVSLIIPAFFVFASTFAQTWNYEFAGNVDDLTGTVNFIGDVPVINVDGDQKQRFCGDMLDESLKVEGIKIKFSGIKGAIPPNIRMMCSPLKITKAIALSPIPTQNNTPSATDFEYETTLLKNVKATVKVLNNGELFVIVPDNNENMRYISQQLPKEFKIDGLKVTFTGWEGKIPPNVRMMGKPLKLKCICISKSEMKKHGLKKAKYTFK
jgi:hypothetical protein